jgi:hypothetical protein
MAITQVPAELAPHKRPIVTKTQDCSNELPR